MIVGSERMPVGGDSRKAFLASVVADYFDLTPDAVGSSSVSSQAVNDFLDSGNVLALVGRRNNGNVVFSSTVRER